MDGSDAYDAAGVPGDEWGASTHAVATEADGAPLGSADADGSQQDAAYGAYAEDPDTAMQAGEGSGSGGEGEGEGGDDEGRRLNSVWTEFLTEHGEPYYFNEVTNTTQWEKPDLSQDGDATAAASPDSASGQVDAIDEEVDATGLEANTTRTPVGDTPVGDTPVGDTPADAFSGHMEQGGDDDDAEMLPAFRHNDGDAAGPGVVMDDGLEQARNSPQMAAAAALQLEKARQERLQQAMQRRGKLVDSLVAKDAAIDPCVPTWIAELAAIDANPDFSDVDETTQHGAKSRPLPDIEAVASTLREGFHGYREMYEASFRWLADVHERETERKLPAATLATCDPVGLSIKTVVKLLDEHYSPERAKAVFEGATKEPEFLTKMLSDPDWRQAFINLADKHKSCPVLSYCIKRISEVSAADVFQVASASAYRDVTTKVLRAQLLELCRKPDALSSRLEAFVKFLGHNASAYLFTQAILDRLSRATVSPPAPAPSTAEGNGAAATATDSLAPSADSPMRVNAASPTAVPTPTTTTVSEEAGPGDTATTTGGASGAVDATGAGSGTGTGAGTGAGAGAGAGSSNAGVGDTSQVPALYSFKCRRLSQDLEADVLSQRGLLRSRIARFTRDRRSRGFPAACVHALHQVQEVGKVHMRQWRDNLTTAMREFSTAPRPRHNFRAVQYKHTQQLVSVFTKSGSRPPSLQHLRSPSVLAALTAQAFYPFPEKQDATRLAHCARLLAFAARGRDGGDLIQDTARVQQNITVVARTCNNQSTLTRAITADFRAVLIEKSSKFPVVAMGVLCWIRTALGDTIFVNGPMFRECAMVMVSVLRAIVDTQPLHRREAVDVLMYAFMLQPAAAGEYGYSINDVRKKIIDALVFAMSKGLPLAVLRFASTFVTQVDRSLVRHFVSKLVGIMRPRYSVQFMAVLLKLLCNQQCHHAMRDGDETSRRRLVEFVRYCDKYKESLDHGCLPALEQVKAWAMPHGAPYGTFA